MTRRRVIVVGGGVGGLSAALSLSRDYEVRVIEGASRLGGKMGFAVIDGVRLDTGPSVLTLPHYLRLPFEVSGTLNRFQALELKPLHRPFLYRFFDGVEVKIFHDVQETLESVRSILGKKEADELSRFLGYSSSIWGAAESHFVRGPSPSLGQIMRMGFAAIGLLRRIDPLKSMQKAIDERVTSPYLRSILYRYATYNGSDARRAPATLNTIAHVELGLGGYGVGGGMYSIVEAFRLALEDCGVEVELNNRVLDIRSSRVGQTVLTENGERHSSAAIVNADYIAFNRVRPSVTDFSTSGWVGIKGIPAATNDASFSHAVLFPEYYLAEFEDLFDRRKIPSDPAVYLCNQTQAHGVSRFSDSSEPTFFMINAPAFHDDSLENEREKVDRRLNEHGNDWCHLPWRWERKASGLAREFPGTGGALYGLASNSMWSAFRRPSNRDPKRSRVYYASGSVHPGGGVPLCAQSGAEAARRLRKELP